jgi:hypothetical protein
VRRKLTGNTLEEALSAIGGIGQEVGPHSEGVRSVQVLARSARKANQSPNVFDEDVAVKLRADPKTR